MLLLFSAFGQMGLRPQNLSSHVWAVDAPPSTQEHHWSYKYPESWASSLLVSQCLPHCYLTEVSSFLPVTVSYGSVIYSTTA